jgi:hypothetical protein
MGPHLVGDAGRVERPFEPRPFGAGHLGKRHRGEGSDSISAAAADWRSASSGGSEESPARISTLIEYGQRFDSGVARPLGREAVTEHFQGRHGVAYARGFRQTEPMGLKNLFSRWAKGEDRRAIERAELESRMTPHERAVDSEDFEARKADTAANSSWAGSEAAAAASDDLESP